MSRLSQFIRMFNKCPECGAESFRPCIGKRGQERTSLHLERIRNQGSRNDVYDITISSKVWHGSNGSRILDTYQETWTRRAK